MSPTALACGESSVVSQTWVIDYLTGAGIGEALIQFSIVGLTFSRELSQPLR